MNREDDIANAPENPTPGIIFNHIDGPDVYAGVPKDYNGNNCNSVNFLKVLQGEQVQKDEITFGIFTANNKCHGQFRLRLRILDIALN